jgi:hypothetical protein
MDTSTSTSTSTSIRCRKGKLNCIISKYLRTLSKVKGKVVPVLN